MSRMLQQMPSYAKFMKGFLSRKLKLEESETIALTEECSAVLQQKLPPKLKDPGSFTISCTIGELSFDKCLCDLGASINLMSLSIFRKLVLPDPKPTNMSLQLAIQSITYLRGTCQILIDVQKGELTIRVQHRDVTFNIFNAMKFPTYEDECYKLELVHSVVNSELDQLLRPDTLERALIGKSDSEDEKGVEQLQFLNASS
ncbi:uncharacterized protein LOC141680228 [Apium graveolens]|uniref:uncharacterized protein LOC141680228 n=1 Tax=Apium graveolens TaxID=4045 RepID=UPI003D7B7C0E